MTLGVAAGQAREHEPLVGRADELDALEQVLDELDRGPPGAIELVGEPGIGKTRLPLGARGSCGAARAPRPLGVGVGARARAAVFGLRACVG